MNQVIQTLVILLLVAALFLSWRIWELLGALQQSIKGLEQTRSQAAETISRANAAVLLTERLLKEELEPTAKSVRSAIGNFEIASKSLSDSVGAMRRLTSKAETASGIGRALAVGGAIAGMIAGRHDRAAAAKTSHDARSDQKSETVGRRRQ